MTKKRAPLSDDIQSLRNTLVSILPTLESKPGWYGSIFLERRTRSDSVVNLKQTQASDQTTMGIVFRIYNGYTLFEQATDDIEPISLQELAKEFSNRVASTSISPSAKNRPYQPPNWATRLKSTLDPDLTSQLPKNLTAHTPVHFGISFEKNPKSESIDEQMARLKGLLERCKSLAPRAGLSVSDLTYIMARQIFSEEESVFIDRETNMSQTLYRMALVLVTMSGADRTYMRPGGLGGLEVISLSDEEIIEQLQNLKGVKNAERLTPGKYRLLMGPVLSGVLAHEAFGHGQEADTCARGRSKAWELHHSGEKVGNQHATILNNPAAFSNGEFGYAAWGSYFFDEEGWLASSQVLLDQGTLKEPMTNLTSALRLGVPRTANGKRENWSHGVYSRQTNTYFSAGDSTLEDLISKMGDGFLATEPAGGMEDPKGMGIQVGISFLLEVKNGKRTGKFLKGPAGGDIQLTGYVPDVLNSIIDKSKIEFNSNQPDRVQHPFNDAGGCGKYHKEFVYAGCGGPYMLLEGVTLG